MKKIGVCFFILISLVFVSLFIVSAQEGKVNEMLGNLHWLGHASFRLDGAKVIYFDPWKLSKDTKRADIILVTHEHLDHYSLNDIRLISDRDTIIVTTGQVSRNLKDIGVFSKEVKPLLPGESTEIFGIKINAVYSYNTNKQFHTKESAKLGFIVTIDGVKIYHAGDTDLIPQMKDYHCDIALLPVSGTYVMSADEAAKAALLIKPKAAIPMHYADIVGTDEDAVRFRDLLKDKIEVKIFKRER